MRITVLHVCLCAFGVGVPADAQSPARFDRACLEGLLDRYVDALVARDPSRLPAAGTVAFTENGQRLENGSVTAVDPAAVPGYVAPASAAPARRSSCLQQFQAGVFSYVTRIRDRRFVAVDPERGLAFAFAFFDNGSGDARTGTLTDGRKVVSGPSVPWTWQIAEVFKIERGKIAPVESVLHQVPYGMGSGWSTWEEAMSSRARWSLQR